MPMSIDNVGVVDTFRLTYIHVDGIQIVNTVSVCFSAVSAGGASLVAAGSVMTSVADHLVPYIYCNM